MGILDLFKRRRAEPPAPVPQESPPVRLAPPDGSVDYVSPYLDASLWDELLTAGPDGLPPLYLAPHQGAWWLAEDTTGKLVNVANKHLRRLGVWSVRVRGGQYAPGELHIGAVELVREPENEFDPNAIAIHQNGQRVGYWNKGMAPGLAKVLDAGVRLQSVAISVQPPKVIACTPEIMAHLRRRL